MMQEVVGETDGAEWQAHCFTDVSLVRDREFATASSQINHQHRRRIDAQSGSQAEMNQARLFQSRNNFDAPSCRRPDPLEKRSRISSITQGTGRNHVYGVDASPLRRAMKPPEHLHGRSDGLGRKKSTAENRLTQPRDFAVFVDINQVVRGQAGNLQANRIRSNVNGSKSWHAETV